MIHLIVGNTGAGKTTYAIELKRNHKKGETFEFKVSQENFDFIEACFEKPDENELNDGVRITEQRDSNPK